jgi:hypothetical protein
VADYTSNPFEDYIGNARRSPTAQIVRAMRMFIDTPLRRSINNPNNREPQFVVAYTFPLQFFAHNQSVRFTYPAPENAKVSAIRKTGPTATMPNTKRPGPAVAIPTMMPWNEL